MDKYFSLKTNRSIYYQLIDTPLLEREVRVSYLDPQMDPAELLAEHPELYPKSVPLFPWPEVLLGFTGEVITADPTNLEMKTNSSYHARSMRFGDQHDFTPAVVSGLLYTADHKLVYGIHSGDINAGKANIAPAGYVRDRLRNAGRNPIFAAFYGELEEELGLSAEDVKNVELIGMTTDQDFTGGLNFVFLAFTRMNSNDIDALHREALSHYHHAKLKRSDEEEARVAIGKADKPNKDAWKYAATVFIHFDAVNINGIIRDRKLDYDGREYPLMDIGRMSLVLLRDYSTRNGTYF